MCIHMYMCVYESSQYAHYLPHTPTNVSYPRPQDLSLSVVYLHIWSENRNTCPYGNCYPRAEIQQEHLANPLMAQ